MPAPYLYFTYAFGEHADDLTAIPVPAAVDGSVSYYSGWTDPYEYNLVTNPAALPIPRGQMNQLFYDITNNLQEYQQYGTPQWVTGNTVLYPIYARVYYLGAVYENQTANNTATPGTDATWTLISGNLEGVRTGTVIDWAGITVPSGYLSCDGSGVARTTYATLLAAISSTQNGTTTNTLNTLTGLTDTSQFYIGMDLEGAGIPANTTVLSITSGTSITMSATASASATVPVQFFSWGNGDGSTTFNIPDLRRKVTMGQGGTVGAATGGVPGNVVSSTGGEEAHSQTLAELHQHNHSGSVSFETDFKNGTGANGMVLPGQGFPAASLTLSIANSGNSVAANVTQPSTVFYKCIKY